MDWQPDNKEEPVTNTKIAAPPVEVTGYRTEETLFATRYKQGGRTVFSISLSPDQIMNLIPRPDPDETSPGNRRIRPAHAAGFGQYFNENPDWVSPSIILRAPSIFAFEAIQAVDGAEFGFITYPKRKQGDIQILDGQHRTLGFHLGMKSIEDGLQKARSLRTEARRQDPHGAAFKEAEKQIRDLEKIRDRYYSDRLAVEIQVTDDLREYRQMFYDIAENALGITASVKARFDTRKVVNRALPEVLEHPLLKNRVDLEADRVGRGSEFLMGAKHVAEITKITQVGLEGRVSRRQNQEWSEAEIANKAKAFFTLLTETFPPIAAVEAGQLMPSRLRKTSLLGSVLMLRILADVDYKLTTEHAFDRQMVADFFGVLAPHMEAPVYPASVWLDHTPEGVFIDGASAPGSRRQDIKLFRDLLIDAAITKPKWLAAKPKPRPEPEIKELELATGMFLSNVDLIDK